MRALSEQIAGAGRWLWARRAEAAAGALVFVLTILASAARPGPWWEH